MAKNYKIKNNKLYIDCLIPELLVKTLEFSKIIDLSKDNVWYKEMYLTDRENYNYLEAFIKGLNSSKYKNYKLVSSLNTCYGDELGPLKKLDTLVNGDVLEKMKNKEFFCEFRIGKKFSNLEGVYLWVVDKKIIYVGEGQDLKKRFDSGYGHISPRNVFVGGQSTNCKMNLIVSSFIKENKSISIYFYDTSEIEKKFKDKKYKSSREFIENKIIELLPKDELCNKQV